MSYNDIQGEEPVRAALEAGVIALNNAGNANAADLLQAILDNKGGPIPGGDDDFQEIKSLVDEIHLALFS